MDASDLKSQLRSFLEDKGINFDMDPEEVDWELQRIMPAGRFNKYQKAAFATRNGDRPTGIYRTMSTRAEANTLISSQAEVYLDTNSAVIERILQYLEGSSVVWEMGCMNGLCAEWLASTHSDVHVYGADRVGSVLRDADKRHSIPNLEFLTWDYSASMPRSDYQKADVIYSVLGIEQPVDGSKHRSTDPQQWRDSEYFRSDVERYSVVLERWGRVCGPATILVTAQRLPGHNEKLAFIDALSGYGWDVDLGLSTHVYTDEQWIPLLVARRIENRDVPIKTMEKFLTWDSNQSDNHPGHTPDLCEGSKAVLALNALGERNIVHSDSLTYGDGHTMHIEIGQNGKVGYILGIATTGFLKFREIPETEIDQYTLMDVNEIATFVF